MFTALNTHIPTTFACRVIPHVECMLDYLNVYSVSIYTSDAITALQFGKKMRLLCLLALGDEKACNQLLISQFLYLITRFVFAVYQKLNQKQFFFIKKDLVLVSYLCMNDILVYLCIILNVLYFKEYQGNTVLRFWVRFLYTHTTINIVALVSHIHIILKMARPICFILFGSPQFWCGLGKNKIRKIFKLRVNKVTNGFS